MNLNTTDNICTIYDPSNNVARAYMYRLKCVTAASQSWLYDPARFIASQTDRNTNTTCKRRCIGPVCFGFWQLLVAKS
jgi:hypothetical protein